MSKFIEQGRLGSNSVFYYILTLFICISGMAALHGILYNNFNFKTEDSNQVLILALIPFTAVIALIVFNTRLLHRRSVASLFNTINNFRFPRFIIALLIWFILMICTDLVNVFVLGIEYSFSFNKEKFLPLCIIALGLFPIQTLAEELFFRSYILQGLSTIYTKSIFAIVMSSIFFMGAHMMNPEVEQYGVILMCTYYFLSGFFLALITGLDNGIEQSFGIHTATNLYGALIISYEGAALKTDALWTIQKPSGMILVAGSVISMFIYYAISRNIFKLYKFTYLLEEYKKIDDKISAD